MRAAVGSCYYSNNKKNKEVPKKTHTRWAAVACPFDESASSTKVPVGGLVHGIAEQLPRLRILRYFAERAEDQVADQGTPVSLSRDPGRGSRLPLLTIHHPESLYFPLHRNDNNNDNNRPARFPPRCRAREKRIRRARNATTRSLKSTSIRLV